MENIKDTCIVCWTTDNGQNVWNKVSLDSIEKFLYKKNLIDLDKNAVIDGVRIFGMDNKFELKSKKETTPLTNKETMVYNSMINYQNTYGYPPTVRELCELSGYASTSTVHGHIVRLEKKGYIQRDYGKPRAIQL